MKRFLTNGFKLRDLLVVVQSAQAATTRRQSNNRQQSSSSSRKQELESYRWCPSILSMLITIPPQILIVNTYICVDCCFCQQRLQQTQFAKPTSIDFTCDRSMAAREHGSNSNNVTPKIDLSLASFCYSQIKYCTRSIE